MANMNITAEKVLVFKNVKDNGKITYRATIGHKDVKTEKYTNAGITLRFKNGVELEDRTSINIKAAKLDHFEVEDNKPVWYVMVYDFDIAESATATA